MCYKGLARERQREQRFERAMKRDLKSVSREREWGFESLRPHQFFIEDSKAYLRGIKTARGRLIIVSALCPQEKPAGAGQFLYI